MAVETTMELELTVQSLAKTSSGNDITPTTETFRVPVARSEASGIKQRIATINAGMSATVMPEDEVGQYAYALRQAYLVNPNGPEELPGIYNYRCHIESITGARMIIVETENIYDYRNA